MRWNGEQLTARSGYAVGSQRAVAQRRVWINALPVAVDDYIALVNWGTNYVVEPLANDRDADGDILQIVSVDSSAMAEVTLI